MSQLVEVEVSVWAAGISACGRVEISADVLLLDDDVIIRAANEALTNKLVGASADFVYALLKVARICEVLVGVFADRGGNISVIVVRP